MTKKKLLTAFILLLLAPIVASVAVVMYLRSIDIHKAALYGDIDRVERILLKKPELLEARDKLGYTPLHWASSMGYQNMAEMLLAKGADINATHDGGGTPLHVAINPGYDTRFYMSKSDGEGQRYSILYEKTKMVSPKVMVEFLIASGADVDAKDNAYYTPLHKAVDDDVDVAKILIAHGADINAKSLRHGLTPLHDAAYGGHEEVVRILIDNGADVNTKTIIEGNTPLHKAVICGENAESVCKVLLEGGADVSARNSAGLTPLQQALKYDETQVASLLRKHGGME